MIQTRAHPRNRNCHTCRHFVGRCCTNAPKHDRALFDAIEAWAWANGWGYYMPPKKTNPCPGWGAR